jgi:rsbT co-antagonist protein RsbR
MSTPDNDTPRRISTLIQQHIEEIQADWIANLKAISFRSDAAADEQLRRHCGQLLAQLVTATQAGGFDSIEGGAWDDTRQLIAEISQSRVRQGYSPIDTASFMFSLKEPLFVYLRKEITEQPQQLGDAIISTSKLFDELGLLTIAIYQKAREQIIVRQQQELLELSTPVVQAVAGRPGAAPDRHARQRPHRRW